MTAQQLDPRVVRSKALVLETTVELLLSDAIESVTIDRIVAKSGVARTTIYRHWPGRAELVWEAIDSIVPHAPDHPAGQPVRAALTEFMTSSVGEVDRAPWARLIPALLDAAERDPEMATFQTRIVNSHVLPLRQILQAGVEQGELVAELDVDEAVSLLAGPVFHRRFFTRAPMNQEWARRHVERFLDQFGTDAPANKTKPRPTRASTE